jgi:hypothetical protein
MRRLLFLLTLCGCEAPVEDDVAGQLVQMTVSRVSDDCLPARVIGDAGVQFFGVRDDGGIAFTVGQETQFGPSLDGGVLESVQRQTIPFANGGRGTVGAEAECVGTFSAWVFEPPATLRNVQTFPGVDKCISGPSWLPKSQCTVEREFTFTPISDCRSKCVTITAAGEVSCGC